MNQPTKEAQQIERLKTILSEQITWYKENLESRGEDYVYDELYGVFNNLRRGDFCNIIETLVGDEK